MCLFVFLNESSTLEIYTLSLHDALPILRWVRKPAAVKSCSGSSVTEEIIRQGDALFAALIPKRDQPEDRKSTRLNSSHTVISYAVFCLKKKNRQTRTKRTSTGRAPHNRS